MNKSYRVPRFLLIVSLALAIAGCATALPGMSIEDSAVVSGSDKDMPQPIIKAITPGLIAEEKSSREIATKQDVGGLTGTAAPYVIGKGDLLSILVWNYPELNIAATGAQALSSYSGAQTPAAYVVDQSGRIQFPFVGPIELAGLTELQARDKLAAILFKSIKKPDVTLRVLSFRSKKVYVDGEVKSPGNQVIDDVPMTLLEAVTRAGGMLESADQSAILVSRGTSTYTINLPALVRQGINPSTIILADGDVVRVRSRDENKVYVLGEVNAPRALPLVNGRMTLTEALGEAGGLNQLSAAGKQVYVVRNVSAAHPSVYNLDAKSPVALALADNFELNPRDVVFVDTAGLARFNRIMSLILPNAASATSSYYNVKVPAR
jgi:polysaccharide export outer membrane protein